jgi:hypothetical protein
MTCCELHTSQGGTCRGLIKNPADKTPFYVCPPEMLQIRETLKVWE